jgi:6-phosphogluconolactonase
MSTRQIKSIIFPASIAVFLVVTVLITGSSCKGVISSSSDVNTIRMYVGSFVSEQEPGIHLYEFDIPTNNFEKIQELAGNNNPGFLALNPRSGHLYAVNGITDYEGGNTGSVTSFSVDKKSGMLSYLNRQSSLGGNPCHISVLPDGKHVAVANYSGGSLTLLPVLADGSLDKASGFVQHEGSGPHPRRQRSPYAHSIYPVNNGWLLAADLGIDKVLAYRVGKDGELIASSHASLEPGAGPRHLAFHPAGQWIYAINELNSTITRLDFDSGSGKMTVLESISTLPADYEGNNSCADIHVHPGGKFLYASNRGHNSIAVYSISPDGSLKLLQHEDVRGEWPRNFNIDPSGRLLFVANQNSGNITVFDIDAGTGRLTFTGNELEIKQPVCIIFANR